MWVRRDPDTGQAWQDFTAEQMTYALRNPLPPPSQLLRQVDDKTVAVIDRESGQPDGTVFRWED